MVCSVHFAEEDRDQEQCMAVEGRMKVVGYVHCNMDLAIRDKQAAHIHNWRVAAGVVVGIDMENYLMVEHDKVEDVVAERGLVRHHKVEHIQALRDFVADNKVRELEA